MNEPEQFRDDMRVSEGYRPEPARGDFSSRMEASREQGQREPLGRSFGLEGVRDADREAMGKEAAGRIMGSPLPGTPLPGTPQAGGTGNGAEGLGQRGTPPGRALAGPSASAEDRTAMERAMGILKQAAPFVARLLPLIDANMGSAIANLFTGRQHSAPTPVTVDLAPVKNQLADLQAQQTDLRSTLQEQTAGLKRVENQLDLVREATDRNTLEQQELLDDLKSMGRRVNRVALGISILLLASLAINLYLYYYIRRVLP